MHFNHFSSLVPSVRVDQLIGPAPLLSRPAPRPVTAGDTTLAVRGMNSFPR